MNLTHPEVVRHFATNARKTIEAGPRKKPGGKVSIGSISVSPDGDATRLDVVMDGWFGVEPVLAPLDEASTACFVDYRNLVDGSQLWQVQSQLFDLRSPTGGDAHRCTVQSELLWGEARRVDGLDWVGTLEGSLTVELEPDASAVFRVHPTPKAVVP